ncbi:MAG: hypothetical protein BWK73_51805 [Thiothrix lacustris]|uniref:DUF4395 domain-containing protein n=1 Tax=Thiothrix lacustris TaxID=525917 RepID=A0A1Y1Q7S6_9GAMM|nr:MAG: hypothetical protein BWK73_51805 [Thiothrix lacustris]
MNKHFYFGEVVDGYAVRVLNEREARAGAGLLFMFAILSFLYAYRTMDFRYTSIFITFFMVDFFIRVLVNPKYAPSLIIGRFFVSRQKPEYVGAAQKRFAWSIGLALSIIMFWLVVMVEMMTPIKIYICIACLILLFSETAFGICIGCILHNWIRKTPPTLCPGGVCEVRQKEAIQRIDWLQSSIALVTLAVVGMLSYQAFHAI